MFVELLITEGSCSCGRTCSVINCGIPFNPSSSGDGGPNCVGSFKGMGSFGTAKDGGVGSGESTPVIFAIVEGIFDVALTFATSSGCTAFNAAPTAGRLAKEFAFAAGEGLAIA